MTTINSMEPAVELTIVMCTEEILKNKQGEEYRVKTIYGLLPDESNGYSVKASNSHDQYDDFVEGATVTVFPNEDGTATFYRQLKYSRIDREVASQIKGQEFTSVSIVPNDNQGKLMIVAHLEGGEDVKLSNFEIEDIKEDKTTNISLKYDNPTIKSLIETIKAGELPENVLATMQKSVDAQLTAGKTKAIERVMTALGVEDFDIEQILEGVEIEDFEPWEISIGEINGESGKVRFAKGHREE